MEIAKVNLFSIKSMTGDKKDNEDLEGVFRFKYELTQISLYKHIAKWLFLIGFSVKCNFLQPFCMT